MKKLTKLIMCCLLLLSGCQKKEEEVNKIIGSKEEIAISLIQDCADQNYKNLYQKYDFDNAMLELVNNKQLEQTLKPSFIQLGNIKEIKQTSSYNTAGYQIIEVPVMFSKQNANIIIAFNSQNQIAGINFNEYSDKVLSLPTKAVEIETSLTIDDNHQLPGILTLPKTEGKFPVVILVHGSGSSDMDETILTNKPFRDIAYLLAEKGIATYRYDKRTYVYGSEFATDIYFTVNDETVDDAVIATEMLKQLDNIDPNQVYVLGHSLGGMMIPRIEEKSDVAGVIMMAAPASKLNEIMLVQFDYLEQFANAQAKLIYDQTRTQLKALENLDDFKEDEIIVGAYKAYWKDLLSYDQVEKAKNIQVPVLLLQGEQDCQVFMSEYEIWQNAFDKYPNWTLKKFTGLNHLMMEGSLTEDPSIGYARKSTVDQRVIEEIAKFILK